MKTKNKIQKISRYAASASALLLGTQADGAIVTNDITDLCFEPTTIGETLALDIDGDGVNDVSLFAYDPSFDDVFILLTGNAIGIEESGTTLLFPSLIDVDFDCVNSLSGSSGTIHTLGVGAHGFAPVLFNINGAEHLGVVELTTVAGTGSQSDDVRKVIVHSFTYNDVPAVDDACFVSPPALSVELAKFDAYGIDNKVVLEWMTISEINNEGFEVERSINGNTWERIGFEIGKGTTNVETKYSWIDEDPYAPQAYYRLKQMDFNGESTYSPILSVNINKVDSKLELLAFPNPTLDYLSYNLPNVSLKDHEVSIWTTEGKLVVSKTIQDQGIRVLNLTNMENGTYILNVKMEGNNYSKLIVKQ